MSGPAEHVPHGPDDRVFPAPDNDDLWMGVYSILRADYPDRLLPEHARWAFEAVCAERDDHMPFKDFLRKVRLKWLWQRPRPSLNWVRNFTCYSISQLKLPV